MVKGRPQRPRVQVEVLFEGCQANERMIDLCLEEARCLEMCSRSPGSCTVAVTQRARQAEIRIDLQTSRERIALARLYPAADEPQLRTSLGEAFTQMVRRLEESQQQILPVPHRLRTDASEGDLPPSVWYG